MLELAYQKTDAGRAEIKTRALGLSRSARNLLLVIDGTRTAEAWLGLVNGCSEADLLFLLEQGLIAPAAGARAPAVPAPLAVAAPAPAPQPGSPLPPDDLPVLTEEAEIDIASVALRYEELYSLLTQYAKQYLGLLKGYRMVLEVERCADLSELQDLARRFLDDVRQAQGDDVAAQLRQALSLH